MKPSSPSHDQSIIQEYSTNHHLTKMLKLPILQTTKKEEKESLVFSLIVEQRSSSQQDPENKHP